MNAMTILICGSPGNGFQIIGLFANSADAQSYAEDYSLKDWWVAELGICGKSSGDGFEVPSLTDFRNRLSKLVPLCGAHVENRMGRWLQPTKLIQRCVQAIFFR